MVFVLCTCEESKPIFFSDCIDVFVPTHRRHRYSSTPYSSFSEIRIKYFMTISIFALKGEVNGKILLLHFFFVGIQLTTE